MKTLFSVVTITYNAEKYLGQTLASVASQDFHDYEHILWDGGSNDRTLEVARSFPHAAIYTGKDRGIADAMNRAITYASGKFVLFLHADDLLAHPRVLSSVATTLEQHPHVDWLYGRAHIINEEGIRIRTTPLESFSHKRLRRYNFITHPATFVARTLFQKVGGFETDLRYCMDYDLWQRLAQFSTPFPLPLIVASFREHSHSLSTSEPLHVADEAYRVRNRYVNSLWERYRSYRTWRRRRETLLRTPE